MSDLQVSNAVARILEGVRLLLESLPTDSLTRTELLPAVEQLIAAAQGGPFPVGD